VNTSRSPEEGAHNPSWQNGLIIIVIWINSNVPWITPNVPWITPNVPWIRLVIIIIVIYIGGNCKSSSKLKSSSSILGILGSFLSRDSVHACIGISPAPRKTLSAPRKHTLFSFLFCKYTILRQISRHPKDDDHNFGRLRVFFVPGGGSKFKA
jgi:hypothetical protein